MEDLNFLLEEYGPSVYGFCIRLTKSRQDADDLYQSTMLTAIQKKIDLKKSPKAYLMKICVSHYKNEERKRRRREKIAPTVSFDEALDKDSDLRAEESIFEKELYKALKKHIDSLEEGLKITLLLYYTQEKSVKETAKILSLPEGTVKSRLHKARQLVKKGLEDEGYEG